jgi:hypothetical protein
VHIKTNSRFCKHESADFQCGAIYLGNVLKLGDHFTNIPSHSLHVKKVGHDFSNGQSLVLDLFVHEENQTCEG